MAPKSLPQIFYKDSEASKERTEQAPLQPSARLYSPSMPHIETIDPSSKEQINGRTPSNQETPANEPKPGISKAITSNPAMEPSRVSASIENRLSGRLAAPVALMNPTVTSRNDHDTGIQDGRHATPPKGNNPSLKQAGILNKPSLPGLLPQARQTLSSKPTTISFQTSTKEATPVTRGAPGYGLSISEKLEALKAMSNGYHSPLTSTRMTSSPVPVSNDPQLDTPQLQSREQTRQKELWQPERSNTGNVHKTDSLSAPIPNTTSPNRSNGYTYQDQPQEPVGAHIVRLEALLRGALLELETIKRIAR